MLHRNYGVPHVVISSLPLHLGLRSELQAAGQLLETAQPSTSEQEGSAYTSDRLLCIASTACSSSNESSAVSEVGVAVFPRIKGYFSGVGDLFSALVLAHYDPYCGLASTTHDSEGVSANSKGSASRSAVSPSTALLAAVEGALATTQAILISTHEHSASTDIDCPPTDDEQDEVEPDRRVRRMRARELRIVQGMEVIRTPPRALVAVRPWATFWATKGAAVL